MSDKSMWLFAYGSLMWRPDFAYAERIPARIHGWTRRFWQGSHDHRGRPEAPGRVVTLVPDPESHCDGIAYRLSPDVAGSALDELDYREKNGYGRVTVRLDLRDGRCVQGTVYIAHDSNRAFLGAATVTEIARQIVGSSGPSGSNMDYVLRLAETLRDIDVDDPHVSSVESAVRDLRLSSHR